MGPPTLLLNGVYWSPVGHAVEALQHAYRYKRARPELSVSIVLNRHTTTELADLCRWLGGVYEVDLPEGSSRADPRLWSHVPREWDQLVSDPRSQAGHRHGGADAYVACQRGIRDRVGAGAEHATWDDGTLPYDRAAYLRLPVEPAALGARRPRVAVMPAGSGPAGRYPSRRSWEVILDALADELGAAFVLVGRRSRRGSRSRSSTSRGDLRALLARHPDTIDQFDRPLLEQLAHVAACDLFVSPHTGFAYAALAVGTPWLTISGGRWSEYFMSGVPFHSVLPDPSRFPAFADRHLEPRRDGRDGPRIASMLHERIVSDLPEIVESARALVEGRWEFSECERRHWERLVELERAGALA